MQLLVYVTFVAHVAIRKNVRDSMPKIVSWELV